MPTENRIVTDAELQTIIAACDPFQRAATESYHLPAIARVLALQPEPETL